MNKQELIEEWSSKTRTPEPILIRESFNYADPVLGIYEQGFLDARTEILRDLEQLDEPQKPVVAKCAEPFLKNSKYSTDVIDLFSEVEYATDSDGFISDKWRWSGEFYDWLVEDADTLYILCDALRYGYEVEKEPLYYVKHKNDDTYFVGFINSDFSCIWDDEIEHTKLFTDKAKADAVAVLVVGEVVEG